MNDLKTWLERLGLGRPAVVLAENDLDVLAHPSDDDLAERGLSPGHRRSLLGEIGIAFTTIPGELCAFMATQRRVKGIGSTRAR